MEHLAFYRAVGELHHSDVPCLECLSVDEGEEEDCDARGEEEGSGRALHFGRVGGVWGGCYACLRAGETAKLRYIS